VIAIEIKSIINSWLDTKSSSTMYSYKKTIESLFRYIGCNRLEDISIDKVKEYVTEVKNNEELSYSYQYSIISALRSFFKYVYESTGLYEDALDYIIHPQFQKNNEKSFLSLNEITSILAKARKKSKRDYILTIILYLSEIQLNTLTSITWGKMSEIPEDLHSLLLTLKDENAHDSDKIFGLSRSYIWKILQFYHNGIISPLTLRNSLHENSREIILGYIHKDVDWEWLKMKDIIEEKGYDPFKVIQNIESIEKQSSYIREKTDSEDISLNDTEYDGTIKELKNKIIKQIFRYRGYSYKKVNDAWDYYLINEMVKCCVIFSETNKENECFFSPGISIDDVNINESVYKITRDGLFVVPNFKRVCDYVILVGILEDENRIWVVPSDKSILYESNIIHVDLLNENKIKVWRESWRLIEQNFNVKT
jgi:hypothetical protein